MDFNNVYNDAQRAEAYSKLEYPGTYYLAFRDIPRIISTHVTGKSALDFGCGTGRSTRFLKALGFETIGIDIAENMLKQARSRDPHGDYRLIKQENFDQLEGRRFDLILAAFTFDNIPLQKKASLFTGLSKLLRSKGKIINMVSSPDIYLHEWASFSTKDFYLDNKAAKSGDRVKIIITDVEDQRPVEDIMCTDESYREIYEGVGLGLVETYAPLGKENESIQWINETRIAPWVIYVLNKL